VQGDEWEHGSGVNPALPCLLHEQPSCITMSPTRAAIGIISTSLWNVAQPEKNRLKSLSKKGCIVGLFAIEEVLRVGRSVQMDHLADNTNIVLGIDVHILRGFDF
jgi:hypothetical protein